MHPLETYASELRDLHSSGHATKETSYYPALRDLLNEVGKGLKPKVRCIVNPRDLGAGLPDGGLFTPDQFPRGDASPINPASPARGVIEVKSTRDDAWVTADGAQVTRYWNKYGQVLVTNLRDFVLVGRDVAGQSVKLETFRLADSERAFWAACAHPRKLATEKGARFVDFLWRALQHAAPLTAPDDVARYLASYARAAATRIEGADLPALAGIRAALEESLGLTFEGAKGDHFFRSTFVQTLFYGVFSAWVLWHREKPARTDRFEWLKAADSLRVPMIQTLFEMLARPSQLRPLGLAEVLDWTEMALNRVDRASFFARFEAEHAVQYFYEPFLAAFDPELRKELGVWYTPPEVVKYMVARVDRVLRDELEIADGLADPRVVVLDPCCGTGAYLVEVLDVIAAGLKARGDDALLGSGLKKAATERVFGFEILTAPYVIAHLQLGLLLQKHRAALKGAGERVGVYLTNSLTGWEPPKERKKQLEAFFMHELKEERDAADKVKRDAPILVILGNPPYNGFAGAAMAEERDLTDAYRATRAAPKPQGQGLNDLYVRFFRMAERRIVEQTGRGVVCFISNYSWLDGLSFTGMREKYLDVFDRIWIDCLNGDKYKTGKLTPDGEPDPSVFSTEANPVSIQVGTAIALLVKRPHPPTPSPSSGEGEVGKTGEDVLPLAAKTERGPGGEALSPPGGEALSEPGGAVRIPIAPDVRRRMTEVARDFRKAPTPSEDVLWGALRGRRLDGRKFRRQQPIGPFVADFFCAEERLVVEIDGPIHDGQQDRDRERQRLIEEAGYRVVRVPAAVVERDLARAVEIVRGGFKAPHPPAPSPSSGEGEAGKTGEDVLPLSAKTERGGGGEALSPPGGDALRFRHLWGKGKRAELLASANHDGASLYEPLEPPLELGLPFMPMGMNADYLGWPLLPDLFLESFPGIKTSRDDLLVDTEQDQLLKRMTAYFDPEVTHEDMKRISPVSMEKTARFNARGVRDELVLRGLLRENFFRYNYRPFDVRWLYWEPETKLLDEKRAGYLPHVFPGNVCLVSQQKPRRDWSLPQAISNLGCIDLMDRSATCFPMLLRETRSIRVPPERSIRWQQKGTLFNLSTEAFAYLDRVGAKPCAERLFLHVFAVLHSPEYARENASALRQDWPRIPLLATKAALESSAALGGQVAALLDTESGVKGVTEGTIRRELRVMGNPTTREKGQAADFALTAGWGHAGKGGVVMPGSGKRVERDYTPEERAAIDDGAKALGMTSDAALAQIGTRTLDVYLNDSTYWKNVPEKVWEYTIGGYQVVKKWLSYRERDLLDRDLKYEEAKEVRDMVRRIAAILLLQPALDANYRAVKADTFDWSSVASAR